MIKKWNATNREDHSQVVELIQILRHALVSPLHYVVIAATFHKYAKCTRRAAAKMVVLVRVAMLPDYVSI